MGDETSELGGANGRRDKGDHPRARPDDQHKQRVSGDHYYHM